MSDTRPPLTIADLEPGDHLCCACDTEGEHRAFLVPLLRDGLGQGEKVSCIVDAHTVASMPGRRARAIGGPQEHVTAPPTTSAPVVYGTVSMFSLPTSTSSAQSASRRWRLFPDCDRQKPEAYPKRRPLCTHLQAVSRRFTGQ